VTDREIVTPHAYRPGVARAPRPEYLVLDIETVPDVQRWTRPVSPEGAAPAPDRKADAFPPIWAHRIVVVGYLWLDAAYRLCDRAALIGTGDTPDTAERELLGQVSALAARRPTLVTYNGRSFDLPVIALRSLCHALPMAWYYRDRDLRARYSENGHVDLCDWLADHGAVRAGRLDAISRLVGLPGKLGIDGSQVEGLFAAGQLDAIRRYCMGDVVQTALVFLRFRLLQGRLDPEDYRARTAELLAAVAPDLGEFPVDRAQLLGTVSV
jgi:hypothetical protein